MLIGLFGFYARWLAFYEDRIDPWRKILKKRPPADASDAEQAAKMNKLWTEADTMLLENLKEEIVSGPMLKRPDWSRPFFVKTNWSSLT